MIHYVKMKIGKHYISEVCHVQQTQLSYIQTWTLDEVEMTEIGITWMIFIIFSDGIQMLCKILTSSLLSSFSLIVPLRCNEYLCFSAGEWLLRLMTLSWTPLR